MTLWILVLAVVTFTPNGIVIQVKHNPIESYRSSERCEKEKERIWKEFRETYKEVDYYFWCMEWHPQ